MCEYNLKRISLSTQERKGRFQSCAWKRKWQGKECGALEAAVKEELRIQLALSRPTTLVSRWTERNDATIQPASTRCSKCDVECCDSALLWIYHTCFCSSGVTLCVVFIGLVYCKGYFYKMFYTFLLLSGYCR